MQEQNTTTEIKIPETEMEILRKHFPHCFDKNGNFDLEKFRRGLSEKEISFSTESYGMDWLGKSYARLLASDPPYNTGSDGFVYADNRKFTVPELARLAGIEEEKAKRILEFTQSKSNSHSAWLTFLYPRLYIAKQFLREASSALATTLKAKASESFPKMASLMPTKNAWI